MSSLERVLKNLLPHGLYEPEAPNIGHELGAHAQALEDARSVGDPMGDAITDPQGELLAQLEADYGLPDQTMPGLTLADAIGADTYTFSAPALADVLDALGFGFISLQSHVLTPCTAPCTAPAAPFGWRSVLDVRVSTLPTAQQIAQIEKNHIPAHVLVRWST